MPPAKEAPDEWWGQINQLIASVPGIFSILGEFFVNEYYRPGESPMNVRNPYLQEPPKISKQEMFLRREKWRELASVFYPNPPPPPARSVGRPRSSRGPDRRSSSARAPSAMGRSGQLRTSAGSSSSRARSRVGRSAVSPRRLFPALGI
jgi:hypothetical protein